MKNKKQYLSLIVNLIVVIIIGTILVYHWLPGNAVFFIIFLGLLFNLFCERKEKKTFLNYLSVFVTLLYFITVLVLIIKNVKL